MGDVLHDPIECTTEEDFILLSAKSGGASKLPCCSTYVVHRNNDEYLGLATARVLSETESLLDKVVRIASHSSVPMTR
jgi:hypothetical protein